MSAKGGIPCPKTRIAFSQLVKGGEITNGAYTGAAILACQTGRVVVIQVSLSDKGKRRVSNFRSVGLFSYRIRCD